MKKINCLFVLLILISLMGCASPSETPVSLPTATVTNTLNPTTTPKPATSMVTPFPALQTDGPYLFYMKNVGTNYGVVLMDADGKGQKYISPPKDVMRQIYHCNDFDCISLYGKVAFVGGDSYEDRNYNFELTLNVFDLKTEEVKIVTPLLSKDYLSNLVNLEKQKNQSYITVNLLHIIFMEKTYDAFSWSPDGKYLAFAGQMNGLSSSLYVYEVDTKVIRHLSDEQQQIQLIRWSPNGQKILYRTTDLFSEKNIYNVYVINSDGSSRKKTSSSTNGEIDWLNNEMYFENDGDYNIGLYNLRLVDVITGIKKSVWKGSFQNYVLDEESKWALISTSSPDTDPLLYFSETTNKPISDLFLINLSTFDKTKIENPQLINPTHYLVYPLGVGNQDFILSGQRPTLGISKSSSISILDTSFLKVSASPNKDYWIGLTERGINIYSPSNQLIREIPMPFSEPPFSTIIWSPIPNLLFLTDYQNVYLIDITTGEFQIIEENISAFFSPTIYKWINIP